MKKDKLTIAQKLAKRKYKPSNKFISGLYKFLMLDLVYRKRKGHYHFIDRVTDCDGPCFVIFNHLSRLDHVYVLGATYPRITTMMAAYSEFFRYKFAWVFKMNHVIPKKQYCADTLPIRAISKVFKKGGCVTFAPEGMPSDFGGNKPIVPGTSKMLKHFKVPVYLCYLEGQYLQNTKVCTELRNGEVHTTMSLLFTKEDVQRLSVEEMDEIINQKFRRDEYAWSKEKGIRWQSHGRICDRLEDICFQCPKCGSHFTMKGIGNKIECSACGNGATMDEYYTFHPYPDAVIPASPLEWFQWERQQIINEIRQNPDYRFEDYCQIGNLDAYKTIKNNKTSKIVGEGKIWVDHQGLHYSGTRNGQPYSLDISYKKIYTLITEFDASYFNFYVDGEYFDVFPKTQSVGKFLLLVEEMHRYHVNFYKNFSWNSYMYDGLQLGIDGK